MTNSGDGCTRWKFDFEDHLLWEQYCTIKTLLLDDWNQKVETSNGLKSK